MVKALQNIQGMLQDSGFEVDEVHFDSASKAGDLSSYPGIVVHPPGQHVGRAERAVRTMKEQLRVFVQDRPFLPWGGRFILQAVVAADMYISQRHAKNSKTLLSPYQQLSGRTPVVERDFKAAFGDLIVVENPQEANKVSQVSNPRMQLAVWLRPVFDDHGSAFVLILESGIIVSRIVAKHVGWEGQQSALNLLTVWSGKPRTD